MRRRDRVGRAASPQRTGSDSLTGECDHCAWHTVQDSYSAIVKAYQDHLREHHHDVWVRT